MGSSLKGFLTGVTFGVFYELFLIFCYAGLKFLIRFNEPTTIFNLWTVIWAIFFFPVYILGYPFLRPIENNWPLTTRDVITIVMPGIFAVLIVFGLIGLLIGIRKSRTSMNL